MHPTLPAPLQKTAVVFVHGTWGRGFFPDIFSSSRKTRWFEINSAFYSTVHRAVGSLSPNVDIFTWSGRNSILARKRASIQLAHLLDDRIQAGFTHIIAIGHSHGGNVIVDAVSYTHASYQKLTIITLATPFVTLFDKQQTSSEVLLYYFGYFISCALLNEFISVLFRYTRNDYIAVFIMLVFWILHFLVEHRISPELLESGTSGSSIIFRKPPGLVNSQTTHLFALRSRYDEASVALSLCSFVAHRANALPNFYFLALLIELAFVIPVFLIFDITGIGNTVRDSNGTIILNPILLSQTLMFAIPLRVELWAITRATGILAAVARPAGALQRGTLAIYTLLLRASDHHLSKHLDERWPIAGSALGTCNIVILLISVIITFSLAEMQYAFGYFTWQPSISYEMTFAWVIVISLFAPLYAAFGVLMLRMAVGPELFFRRLNAGLVVDQVPADRIPTTLILIEPMGILRHFIYENPACRRRVMEILRTCAK